MHKKLFSEENQQKILSLAICALISYAPIILFVKSITSLFISRNFKLDTITIYLVLLFLIILSFIIVLRRIKLDILYLIFFFLLVYLLTYLFFPNNRLYMFTKYNDVIYNPLYNLLIFSLPGYMFIRYITNYNTLFKYLTISSIIVVIGSITTYFINLLNGVSNEYMTFSYNMTVHTFILLVLFFEKKKIGFLIISLLGFFMIFVVGARGPIISITVALMIYIICNQKEFNMKIIAFVLMLLILSILTIFIKEISLVLINILNKFGISSRTLQLIYNGEHFSDSGRGAIISEIVSAFTFYGLGLYGDRVVTQGTYSHNIFIEIIVHFGLFGVVLLIVILFIIYQGVTSSNRNIRNLTIIFMVTGFMKLLVSGTYLNQDTFYIMLGLGVNAIMDKKYRIQNKFLQLKN